MARTTPARSDPLRIHVITLSILLVLSAHGLGRKDGIDSRKNRQRNAACALRPEGRTGFFAGMAEPRQQPRFGHLRSAESLPGHVAAWGRSFSATHVVAYYAPILARRTTRNSGDDNSRVYSESTKNLPAGEDLRHHLAGVNCPHEVAPAHRFPEIAGSEKRSSREQASARAEDFSTKTFLN